MQELDQDVVVFERLLDVQVFASGDDEVEVIDFRGRTNHQLVSVCIAEDIPMLEAWNEYESEGVR